MLQTSIAKEKKNTKGEERETRTLTDLKELPFNRDRV